MFKSTVVCSVYLKYSCDTSVLLLVSSKMDSVRVLYLHLLLSIRI